MIPHIALIDDEECALTLFEIHFRKEIRKNSLKLNTFSTPSPLFEFLDSQYQEDDAGIIFLLSDINMPEMNGFEVLKAVKEKHPNLIVIMESAYDTEEYIQKAKSMGADDYITKPIGFMEVRNLIEKYKRAS